LPEKNAGSSTRNAWQVWKKNSPHSTGQLRNVVSESKLVPRFLPRLSHNNSAYAANWADDSKPRPQDTERIQWLLLRCQKLNLFPTMLLLTSDVEDVYEDEVGAIGSIG